jgi:isopentenyl-diphosphate delta-isomerase
MVPESNNPSTQHEDPTAAGRKQDHIELAFRSRVESAQLDNRFYYEPLLSAHPSPDSLPELSFLGKTLRAPLWVSSMTGGTAQAGQINQRLARACAEFGMGMGLGSCRQLLYSNEHLGDFNLRDTLGSSLPFFANLGIAQLEILLEKKEEARIAELVQKLGADGLIIHVNPLQEAMQPEGDAFKNPPIEVIKELLQLFDFKLIVKEVGQGFGPASMKALLQLPLAAVDFAAAGGTNFAKLELLRSDPERQLTFGKISSLGHSAEEMLNWANQAYAELGENCRSKQLIVSGGITDFLDGYYLINKSNLPAIYGQASGFLKYAQMDYNNLKKYVQSQIRGLELAQAFLKIR